MDWSVCCGPIGVVGVIRSSHAVSVRVPLSLVFHVHGVVHVMWSSSPRRMPVHQSVGQTHNTYIYTSTHTDQTHNDKPQEATHHNTYTYTHQSNYKHKSHSHSPSIHLMCEDPSSLCLSSIDSSFAGQLFELALFLYAFVGLAIVCDQYLVASLETLCVRWNVREDVAGATFVRFRYNT